MPSLDWEKIAALVNVLLVTLLSLAYASDHKKVSPRSAKKSVREKFTESGLKWIVFSLLPIFIIVQSINIFNSSRHIVYDSTLAWDPQMVLPCKGKTIF